MSVLKTLENKIAGLVEGTFSRAFRSEVRPVEIARKLAREMEEHKSYSVSRTYAPNEYRVFLSPRDRERFAGYEAALTAELAGYLLEHARRERLTLLSRPVIEFETDDRLGLGEFGIQTRVAQPEDEPVSAPAEAPSGRTMVYSNAERVAEPLEERGRPARSDAAAPDRRQARGDRPGRRHDRAGPPGGHRAGRSQRLAPARRDPSPRGILGHRRPRLDQRFTAQRAPHRRLRGAASPATRSSWARR